MLAQRLSLRQWVKDHPVKRDQRPKAHADPLPIFFTLLLERELYTASFLLIAATPGCSRGSRSRMKVLLSITENVALAGF
jgi:hypothetical protein